jgi:hypothetical protein
VLAEWREANGEIRHRMTMLGCDAPLTTAAGPYPAGLQTFHYSSEYATHADDVDAPVAAGEERGRTAWRGSFGRFVLAEQDTQRSASTIPPGRSEMAASRRLSQPGRFLSCSTCSD